MADFISEKARQFYAETYDILVDNWSGEIDYYLKMASKAAEDPQLIELACGTGRVTIPLAKAGFEVYGVDLSPVMLSIARDNSRGVENIHWIEADMRSFHLPRKFDLIIIPGHSFQNLLTVNDQVHALESIHHHLLPGGKLIVHLDHQNLSWLGNISDHDNPPYKQEKAFTHPSTGWEVQMKTSWGYDPATQTATQNILWEIRSQNGSMIEEIHSGPLSYHCFFRYEFEHLLARTDFRILSVHGSFFEEELKSDSSEMIWAAEKPR